LSSAVTLLGIVAAVCTTASYAPQVRKAWKTGSAEDLSFKMLSILGCGLSLWAVYGWLIEDAVVVSANLVSVAMVAFLLAFKYMKEGRRR
jgi:MtN3 and saliva related transmembrane protein